GPPDRPITAGSEDGVRPALDDLAGKVAAPADEHLVGPGHAGEQQAAEECHTAHLARLPLGTMSLPGRRRQTALTARASARAGSRAPRRARARSASLGPASPR